MDPEPHSRLRWLLPLAGGALLLLVLDATRGELMGGLEVDFGRTLNLPSVGFGRYLALWLFYASLAAASLTVGLVRLVEHGAGTTERLLAAWNAASERRWIVVAAALAFLIPVTLRIFLLGGTPLTDDESAYRFMAEVLASGKVYADSPALKLFFDNRFMINDGKLYAHYFVGWPALLAPGVWLGVPGIMNAVYSALTVPALFLVVRRLTGSGWARLGTVLYLASPMLMVAAATETSHTSCVAALAWFTWFCLRARDDNATWWVHGGAALTFSVAFFVRPISALGIGLPLLVWWLVAQTPLRRDGGAWRLRSLVAFALPALAMAALFLSVNKLQTGSFFEVAYQRAFTYAQENDFRFSLWPEDMEGDSFAELGFGGVRRSLSVMGAALFRLNVSLLGWPCSLLFALFAGRGRLRGVLALSVVCFLALHFFTNNVGIDTFAPMHYFELAWPVLVLSVCGLERLTAMLARKSPGSAPAWPVAAVFALVITSCLSYVPVRFKAISRVADNVSIPWRAHREAGLGRSVVFAPEPFILYCKSRPATGWVFVRPNNDPDLNNEVLWVNHLSVEKNRLLMRSFPDREGYVMAWDQACRVVFLPLDRLAPGSLPDAKVSGIEAVGSEL